MALNGRLINQMAKKEMTHLTVTVTAELLMAMIITDLRQRLPFRKPLKPWSITLPMKLKESPALFPRP